MRTSEHDCMQMARNLVCKTQNPIPYDVYLNNKEVKARGSVFPSKPKSNTFLDTGKVVIGSRHIVSQRPEMDADAHLLQAALLHHSKEARFKAPDLALKTIAFGLCSYVTVSLMTRGTV